MLILDFMLGPNSKMGPQIQGLGTICASMVLCDKMIIDYYKSIEDSQPRFYDLWFCACALGTISILLQEITIQTNPVMAGYQLSSSCCWGPHLGLPFPVLVLVLVAVCVR